MAISEQDKRAIDAAVARQHFIQDDDYGGHFIEMFADYRDTNEFLLETAYEMRKDGFLPPNGIDIGSPILTALEEVIDESYDVCKFESEDAILRIAGFDPSDDMAEEQREYLQAAYPMFPPYNHFLNQQMKVNIMLQTPAEVDQEFTLSRLQYLAMADPERLTDSSPAALRELLAQDSSLKRLVEQQGHTMSELASTMKDYKQILYNDTGDDRQFNVSYKKDGIYQSMIVEAPIVAAAEHFFMSQNPGAELLGIREATMSDFKPGKPVLTAPEGYSPHIGYAIEHFNRDHNHFLTSVCQELENQIYSMGCMTVLASMSMKEFADMMEPGKEITMPKNAMVGIFSPWQGAGSVLEVELEKPLVFRSDDIHDIQVEGVRPDEGWTVDSTYGLIENCWKNPVSITEVTLERKPGLDSMIQSASQRASESIGEQSRGQEPQSPSLDNLIDLAKAKAEMNSSDTKTQPGRGDPQR